MLVHLRASAALVVLMTALTGLAYPLAMTGISDLIFPKQAHGSLIVRDRAIVGSALIGQQFTSRRYFHGRPSAAGQGYDAAASGGTNLGPSSRGLLAAIKGRLPHTSEPVAIDLVTSSGSGLDPDISPAAAEMQVESVAKARGMAPQRIRTLVVKATKARTFGILGEPRVNVLKLNLLLDDETRAAN